MKIPVAYLTDMTDAQRERITARAQEIRRVIPVGSFEDIGVSAMACAVIALTIWARGGVTRKTARVVLDRMVDCFLEEEN